MPTVETNYVSMFQSVKGKNARKYIFFIFLNATCLMYIQLSYKVQE